jgi:LPXTG-motif cell wall-anchored protein
VTQTQPEPQPQEVAQNTPPPQPEAAPAPEPAPAPQELPKTGSPYPLIGLLGVFSLGLFALVRAFRLS